MFRTFSILVFAVSLAAAQIVEEQAAIDSAKVIEAAPIASPAEIDSADIVQQPVINNQDVIIVETSPDRTAKQAPEQTVMVNKSLFDAGVSKKNAGAALTSVGAVFMAFTVTYTILFFTDNQQFGIPLGSSSDGYYYKQYYLNPGIFGLPIAIPCLISGIISRIRGKNMIEDAMKGTMDVSVNVQPYMTYCLRNGQMNAGVSVSF